MNRNLSNCENSPKKRVFRGFNGISHQKMFSRLCPPFFDDFSKLFKIEQARHCYAFAQTNFLARYLVYPRLPPEDGLGTGKISSTSAVLCLGTLRLHVENWDWRVKKLRAPYRNFRVPCPFFSACKWGYRLSMGVARRALDTTHDSINTFYSFIEPLG